MKNEFSLPKERREQPSLASFPAGELLLLSDATKNIWPNSVTEDPEFLHQQTSRNSAREHLDTILSRLPRPEISFEDALAQGLVTEDHVADLYISLEELLKEGSEYQRILLYLPFEFLLPSSTSFTTDRLRDEAPRFQRMFMDAWWKLLDVHDVRANFVDGDVLEVEKRTGDLPRVVKVAHLIPTLIEKGWLSPEDIETLVEENDDETLIQSIADVFPVSSSHLSFDHEASSNEEQESTMTKKREAWLKKEEERKTLILASTATADAIITGTFSKEDTTRFTSPETPLFIQQAFVGGLRIAIEQLARNDEVKTQNLFNDFAPLLLDLWHHRIPSLHDELSKTFFHLHSLHLVSDDELRKLGLTVPAISGPFSSNLPRMENEIHDITSFTHLIEADPFLSSRVFPAMLVFGSRLKGYGSPTADLDIAVFIKPGTSFDEKEAIRAALKTIVKHKHIEGDAVEFWLEESENTLRVRSPQTFDATIGEDSWTHILFGAAWAGNEKTITELRTKLLVPYFFDATHRRTFLEEMERDVLQYRLLHKGYEKFFPVTTPDVFFDPGYRQTATKLFLSNVFLPKLKPYKGKGPDRRIDSPGPRSTVKTHRTTSLT